MNRTGYLSPASCRLSLPVELRSQSQGKASPRRNTIYNQTKAFVSPVPNSLSSDMTSVRKTDLWYLFPCTAISWLFALFYVSTFVGFCLSPVIKDSAVYVVSRILIPPNDLYFYPNIIKFPQFLYTVCEISHSDQSNSKL